MYKVRVAESCTEYNGWFPQLSDNFVICCWPVLALKIK